MKTRQAGVAIVEFALVLPLLLLMTFVVTEFGRAIYQYDTLTKSVREGARYLSIQTPGTRVAQAQNLVVYGNTAGGGTPLALGLSTDQVSAVWATSSGTEPVITTVTVQISGYAFQSLFVSVLGLPFGSVPYSTIQATMRVHTS